MTSPPALRPEPQSSLWTREGLPEALRVLVQDYPREGWQAHDHFHDHLAFWIDRHAMFRRLVGLLTGDVQTLIDGGTDRPQFNARLARLGNHLIGDLHGHHTIEDQYFFPMLVGLDPRIATGFDLLESDHKEIDPTLSDFAAVANGVLNGDEPGPLLEQIDKIERLLDRHLTDEEDLIVPLVLNTGFRF